MSRSIAAVALGSALVLTGCADAGEDEEGVDTSIDGGTEDEEDEEEEDEEEED